MPNRFANPRGVLAELLEIPAEDIPEIWLKDTKIFGLITEYYGPSLKILEELETSDTNTIPRLNAIGTTLDKKEYARKIRARITHIQKIAQQKNRKGFLFWKKG
ncbi:MAG: hypothetical protein WCR47_08360 [Desulfoplanes sp.]